MVSALPLCLLAIAATVVSSQYISSDSDVLESDQPVAERRTFKHKKHIKFLPLIKKHKKFGLFTPHVFGKIRYADVPVYHEAPVKYEVKPTPEFHTVSAPETIIETHHEYAPSFPSFDHSFPAPPSSSFIFVHDKPSISGPPLPPPVFSSPAIPTFFLQPQPVLSIVSLPPQTIPVRVPSPAPVLPTISIVKPAPEPVLSPITVKIPAPALPSLPSPTPAPVIDIPAPSPAPVLPTIHVSTPSPAPIVSIPSPSPAPVLPPVSIPAPSPLPVFPPVKLPLPSIPAPSPAAVFPPVSIAPSPILPSYPSISLPAQPPVLPSLPALPTPAPALPISVSPEPEYPYPPSGTPIPSYIKDVSLPVTEPTPATSTFDEVHGHDEEKVTLPVVKPEHGLFQKFMEWKADKANAAFNHFNSFKQKPVVFPHQPVAVTTVAPPHHVPSFPSLQIPVPFRPLPLTPDFRPPQVFFPHSAPIFPPVKYESFPPNNIQPPHLFNSYGAPIPHDSYAAPVHDSHDRLSPEASEEEPSVLPAPSAFEPQKQDHNDKIQLPEQQEIPKVKNLLPQTNESHERPIYVPEQNTPLNQAVENQPTKGNEGEETPQPEAEDTNPQTPQQE